MQSRKLSQKQIKEIQVAYASGEFKQYELAAMYGVAQSVISYAVAGKFTVEAVIKTSMETNLLERLKELGVSSVVDLDKLLTQQKHINARHTYNGLPLDMRVQWFTESVTRLPDTPELTEFNEPQQKDLFNAPHSSTHPTAKLQLV